MMKKRKDDLVTCAYDPDLEPALEQFFSLVREHPEVLKPVREHHEALSMIFAENGFRLYPTVLRTTLLYYAASDVFIKVLHALTVKDRFLFFIKDRARCPYIMSEHLAGSGSRVPAVLAYGRFRNSRRSFFALKRVEGKSLYDILIREKSVLSAEVCEQVVAEIANVHNLGYWFGDAHLSHVFVDTKGVTGFIDIDSIRQNKLRSLRNMAKDIAGFDHPAMSLHDSQRKALMDRYCRAVGIVDREAFLRLVKYFAERRWKG